MSEHTDEQLYRIATALEKIAEKKETQINEVEIVAGVMRGFSIQLEEILDTTTNEFTLRRDLRNLVRKAQELSNQ